MKRPLYIALGFLFLGLAILGMLLPIIPGTLFLLPSAWFFARSSKRWHRWLLQSEWFGPGLRNWEAHHCISLSAKVTAILCMTLFGGASVLFIVDALWQKLLGITVIATGSILVLRLRTCRRGAASIDVE